MTEAEANQLFNEVIGRVQLEIQQVDSTYGLTAAQRSASQAYAHRAAWLLLESMRAKGAFK